MKSDLLYISHIIETADVVASYIEGVSVEDFLNDRKLCDAVMRNLQILSESTQKISQEMKNKYSDIPWKDIAGFRNILVHDYLEGVDLLTVWNVAAIDLPSLRQKFLYIRNKIDANT
ncbi:DUF86 domain-containing protein [Alphaproteobacteria bacterium]|nr:DUF86 domain-containing protein [Alphaproteobacteria bacterium]